MFGTFPVVTGSILVGELDLAYRAEKINKYYGTDG